MVGAAAGRAIRQQRWVPTGEDKIQLAPRFRHEIQTVPNSAKRTKLEIDMLRELTNIHTQNRITQTQLTW